MILVEVVAIGKLATTNSFNNNNMEETDIKYATTFEDGTLITPYLATAYAEGFCEGEDASEKDTILAWSYLIGTGQCWTLQGSFGRQASGFIENGVIDKDGTINWNEIDLENE